MELTRRGKPVAVVVGMEAFERLSKGRLDFWEAYEDFRRGLGPDFEADVEDTFDDLRDPSPGRDFHW